MDWLEFASNQLIMPEDMYYDATHIHYELPSALLIVAEEYKDVVWC